MKRILVIQALDRAVVLSQPLENCIYNMDCGSEYCSNEYQLRQSKHGFKVSINCKGNCCDIPQIHQHRIDLV